MAAVSWPAAAIADFLAQQFELQHRYYVANYRGADLSIIEKDRESIGRIYVYRTEREIRLMDIALVPQWRGHGIGTALIGELQQEALAAGSSVTLHVEPDNPAQRLYRRAGFHLIEQRGVYDFLGWDPPAAAAASS